MKKYSLLAILALVVAVSLCTAPNSNGPGITPLPSDHQNGSTNSTELVETPTVQITTSMNISRDICTAKGIEGKVLGIHQTGCPACAAAMPILEELEAEFTDIGFEYFNLAVPEENQRLKDLGINPYYVPVAIIDCQALVGVRSKETYQGLLESI